MEEAVEVLTVVVVPASPTAPEAEARPGLLFRSAPLSDVAAPGYTP